ncbi:hypothetical protein KY311_05240 [Candidatus Woesearchaeota archaeon]|nr:hypothetical protein [Candidatus Woesearchaeota archaeon]MBW3016963.1 hypothetical protein [Candidatus Woesearchaeota archaeon]
MKKGLVTGIIIGVLVLLAVVFVPTKPVEVVEEVTKTSINMPVKITTKEYTTEPYTISEMMNYKFETRVYADASVAGSGTQYVLWEVTIRNYEDEPGCWAYDYTVYENKQVHDSGTLKNLCVENKSVDSFTTPLYEMGNVKEEGAINYSATFKVKTIPQLNYTVSGNHTIVKDVEKTVYKNITQTLNETKIKRVNWLFGFTVFSSTKTNSSEA